MSMEQIYKRIDNLPNGRSEKKISGDQLPVEKIGKQKKIEKTYPWYYKLLIAFFILLFTLMIVFYILSPTEAFTYYMLQGLMGLSSVMMHYIREFGIATILVILTLSAKPLLPVIEFRIKNMDKNERYYWRPRSYNIKDGVVLIETFHHEFLKFKLDNMLKRGNRIYLISDVNASEFEGVTLLQSVKGEMLKESLKDNMIIDLTNDNTRLRKSLETQAYHISKIEKILNSSNQSEF